MWNRFFSSSSCISFIFNGRKTSQIDSRKHIEGADRRWQQRSLFCVYIIFSLFLALSLSMDRVETLPPNIRCCCILKVKVYLRTVAMRNRWLFAICWMMPFLFIFANEREKKTIENNWLVIYMTIFNMRLAISITIGWEHALWSTWNTELRMSPLHNCVSMKWMGN